MTENHTTMVRSAHMPSTSHKDGDTIHCSNCAVRNVCMPSGLTAADFARLDAVICTSRKIARGEALYRTGDPFQSIYAIKSGSFKTVVTLRDGREQITGFQIVGEPLGMDGVSSEQHTCDAVALEDSTLCIIPFRLLEGLCHDITLMQQHVHRLMSGEIVRESGLMMLLGSMCAQERVSAFLLNISQRLQVRRYSATEFNLRMTREEMGSYLGMKLETVSRMLSKFQKEKLIDVRGKLIRILDIDSLRRL
jgi:CRP/FNR family transcriptional regulator, anaerobic regulatory protein